MKGYGCANTTNPVEELCTGIMMMMTSTGEPANPRQPQKIVSRTDGHQSWREKGNARCTGGVLVPSIFFASKAFIAKKQRIVIKLIN